MTTADGEREFACFPAAVSVILINQEEELLLLAHPEVAGWQVVNGALEAGETALAGALRETYEEAGSSIQVDPLGTVHVSSFHYDQKVRYMLNITFLFEYRGGEIQPGDDMQGSQFKWASLDEIASPDFEVIIPAEGKWVLRRAVDLYKLWRGKDMQSLPGFGLSGRGKKK